VVAVVFDPRSMDTVAWFRKPHDKVKQWAGDHVHKQVTVDPETGRHRLAPRASFALWLEQMRDQSRPWEAHTSTLAALTAGVLMGGFKELLRHEVEMLQRLDALGRLAGGLAHDFNNILTAIISFASLLQEDLPEDDPSAEDTAEILEAAKRGQRLTSDLRAFSAQETSRQPVVDVMTVLEESRGMLDRLTGDAIELVVERGSTHGHVEISRGQIEQILLNLVVNARDALDGAGTIWVRARVETLPENLTPHDALPAGVYVVLTVTDQGAGMNEETLARIFEPFFTTKTDGTGLGLATCWGIVRRAGGRIVPTSEVGRGATFEVYLPRVLPEPARPSAEDDGAPSAVLLVVDDDDQIRRITTRVLQRAGYEVHAAANGDEALLLLEQYQGTIDLVVTDVMMPRMNGPALVKRLRESDRITRALFMSGYPGHALQEQGFDLEEVDLVTKPFTPKALVARVKQALESPGSGG
jgi:two-component system cell cycle sensor histidine kinase/response regulator CckA